MDVPYTDVYDEKVEVTSNELEQLDIKADPKRDELERIRLDLHKCRTQVRRAMCPRVTLWRQSVMVQKMINSRILKFQESCKKFSIESSPAESDLIDAYIYFLGHILKTSQEDLERFGPRQDESDSKFVEHWLRFSFLNERTVQMTNLWEILTSNKEQLLEYLTVINPGSWGKMELKCSLWGTCDSELLDIKVTPRGTRNQPIPNVSNSTLLEAEPRPVLEGPKSCSMCRCVAHQGSL